MADAYTEFSFKIGAMSRARLEKECEKRRVAYDKTQSSADIRSNLLDLMDAAKDAQACARNPELQRSVKIG